MLLLVGTACWRRWAFQRVSTGNEDSLSRAGNEVSVVIKRAVSMAMQRAVCTEFAGSGGG